MSDQPTTSSADEGQTELPAKTVASGEANNEMDPRSLLSKWANDQDEWVRFIVGEVIQAGQPLTNEQTESAYLLFREEKGLDERTLDSIEPLATDATIDESAPPLMITRISEVRGVNALVPGSVIEPHEALTILYGENGTGKTGYSRIFKALARSRTDGDVLGDIAVADSKPLHAKIAYEVNHVASEVEWAGQHGVAPFTRMSIFDSPSVSYHVDDALEYVYVPAALALFDYASGAVRAVQELIDARIKDLDASSSTLLSRFSRDSSVYAEIETLGASTDLSQLKMKSSADPEADNKLVVLRTAIGALESKTIHTEIAVRQREQRIIEQALGIAKGLNEFDATEYNKLLTDRSQLSSDYETFRSDLFSAASLPATPEATWENFIQAGEAYRQHLTSNNVHDAGRCLYCRQELDDPARDLISRYSSYLEDKIKSELRQVNAKLRAIAQGIQALARPDVETFSDEQSAVDQKPKYLEALTSVTQAQRRLFSAMTGASSWTGDLPAELEASVPLLTSSLDATSSRLKDLRGQAENEANALREKKREESELKAAVELTRSWTTIETQVVRARESERLNRLRTQFRTLFRNLTELAKQASDQLINQNFDKLFADECDKLRALPLKLQFVGRGGKPHRKKVLSTDHKPSLVLSEGEQKVLAIADFLAEARLAGITAPIVFDDPVSSLDWRRIHEVAGRIALLAEHNQVIVFTHDIWFATTLLALFEKSKRCSYFQITDENGKGQVTKASHPRWDTLKNTKAEINKAIEAARNSEGEARSALIRTGYDWIRTWCEVFTEIELLQSVTQRYQPNVQMTKLDKIKTNTLAESIQTVTTVFNDACRFIDGHSQPLPTLGVAPTLQQLEADWKSLQDCKKLNDG